MRIVQAHTRYGEPGGEDVVVAREAELLRSAGHEVIAFEATNASLAGGGAGARMTAAARAAGLILPENRALARLLDRTRPDLLHVHNTFLQMSPAVYRMAAERGIAVVQTVHNYRMLCANALLLRDGSPCTRCVGGSSLPAVRHRCVRGSLAASAVLAGRQALERARGAYAPVDGFVAPTQFVRSMLVRGGFDAERVHVKPHFTADPGRPAAGREDRARRIVYAGRIAGYKGVDLLLEAWRGLGRVDAELVVIGEGPEREALEAGNGRGSGVRWTGRLDGDRVRAEIADAHHLVVPSRCYETFGLVVVEALAAGTPVLAPDHGGFPELVEAGAEGDLFTPGDAGSLRAALGRALALEPAAWRRRSEGARARYEAAYTPAANLGRLLEIYGMARARRERPIVGEAARAAV